MTYNLNSFGKQATYDIKGEVVIQESVEFNGEPYTVTRIGPSAFNGSKGITKVTLPSTVTTIDENAFSGCTGLADINLPDGITSIGKSAFSGCELLSGVTLPAGLTKIESAAFEDCRGIKELTIPKSVEAIGSNAFRGCPIENVAVDKDNEHFLVPDGCNAIVSTDGKKLFRGTSASKIPVGVENIQPGAFSLCYDLSSVELPASLKYIYSYAFEDCGKLETITFPASLRMIFQDAFQNCVNLKSFTIEEDPNFDPESFDAIEYPLGYQLVFPQHAFVGCKNLTDIYVYGGAFSVMADGEMLDPDFLAEIVHYGTRPELTVHVRKGYKSDFIDSSTFSYYSKFVADLPGGFDLMVVDGRKWVYYVADYSVEGEKAGAHMYTLEMNGTSEIGGKTYANVYRYGEDEVLNTATMQPVAFLREEGNKVYGLRSEHADEIPDFIGQIDMFLDNEEERVLYDFETRVNPNFKLDVTNASFITTGDGVCREVAKNATGYTLVEGLGPDFRGADLLVLWYALPTGTSYSISGLVSVMDKTDNVIFKGVNFGLKPNAIEDVTGDTAKTVAGVRYFNLLGVESAEPFRGVNVVVTTYTDGSREARKVVR
ncbi:MAG: leucine-rich repeat domain-containing protein [Muribaculaceae bacterium]|nr:leucine-rich repeat domain-containing protein [Muribaculaceae bacterium]